jgi:hypothetical protein
VAFSDAKNDVAILKSEPGTSFLSFRDDQRLRLGESIIAAGYPLADVMASSLNVTTGSVSALAGLGDDTRMIQFSAPVQPGSSGGPLVDQSGHVVGIVTSKLSPLWLASNMGDIPQNVNFAIKASVVRDFLDSKAVNYSTLPSTSILATTAIAESVKDSVVSLTCAPEGPPPVGTTESAGMLTGTVASRSIQQIGDVRTIAIGSFGNSQAAALVREKLSNRLVRSGKLTVTEDERQSDAVLTGVVGESPDGRAETAVVKLMTQDRRIVWGGEASARGLGSSSASIADKIATELLKATNSTRKTK